VGKVRDKIARRANTIGRSRGRVLPATILAAAILISASIVVAAVPDHNGTIRGCYSKRTGVLRIVDGKSCKRGEKRLQWNQEGPPGASVVGPQGERGPQGSPGTNGANGTDGANGTSGYHCGDGKLTPPEACDDGNTNDSDACHNDCTVNNYTGTCGPSEGTACEVGIGACHATGQMQCTAQGGTQCSAVAGSPSAEQCGDGVDNNCNGQTDEGCP
jgi:cysteine-rich repeat protein